uniref:Ammonium transporter n=1 Tax=Botryococcus braunii TaxID=38881 RepID=A0A218NGN3_BOTBR|nr:ammonium transporter [Botryococcus braunii]
MVDNAIVQILALREIDAFAIMILSIITFFQQVGFASLEAGSIRAKNVRNILLKTVVDKLVCGVFFYCLGFAFAYGQDWKGLIGTSFFALEGSGGDGQAYFPVLTFFFFGYVFLITSTTIVSGALAERANFVAYLVYTPVMATIVYPLVSHWIFSGWLSKKLLNCRYLDFAGGASVHLIGGMGALVASAVIGPRKGRFRDGRVRHLPGHDIMAVASGTLMLWFGWLGFNVAPSFLRGDSKMDIAARALVSTTLAACAGGLTSMAVCAVAHHWSQSGRPIWDLHATYNGIMSGVVVVTSISPYIEGWGALILGFLASLVYLGISLLMVRLRIDDPLDSTAVHAGAATVGLLAVGILAQPDYIRHYRPDEERICGGWIYTHSGNQLAVQIIGTVVIAAFSACFSWITFWFLGRFDLLRVTAREEEAGIDNIDHGGPAYPDFEMRMWQETVGTPNPEPDLEAFGRVGSTGFDTVRSSFVRALHGDSLVANRDSSPATPSNQAVSLVSNEANGMANDIRSNE